MKRMFLILSLALSAFAQAAPENYRIYCSAEFQGPTEAPARRVKELVLTDEKQSFVLESKEYGAQYVVYGRIQPQLTGGYRIDLALGKSVSELAVEAVWFFDAKDKLPLVIAAGRWNGHSNGPLGFRCQHVTRNER